MQADLKLNEPQAQAIELQVPSKDGKGRVLLATIGAESYVAGCRFSYGSERAHLLVGKYTTIADGVTFEIGKGQDTSRIAAYPFFDVVQAKGDIENAERQAYEENRYQIIVGSDVTIGSHAFIEGGIRIGNGAVIRAGAVVREDVPPYAIVEGNPARVTGYRFPQATIDALERIQWWNWPKDNILAQQAKMEDIDAFVKEFDVPLPDGRSSISALFEKLQESGTFIYVFVADFGTSKPLWEQVVDAYLEAFEPGAPVFLFFEIPHGLASHPDRQRLEQMIAEAGDDAPQIGQHVAEAAFTPEVLEHADVFITNCAPDASLAVDFAEMYDTELRSGCNYESLLFGRPRKNKLSVARVEAMKNEQWEQDIQLYLGLQKREIRASVERKDWADTLKRLHMLCWHLYLYGAYVTDDEIEAWVREIEQNVPVDVKPFESIAGNVFFLDSFGLDTRGLALIYLKALHALGYHIIYCVAEKHEPLPQIEEVLRENKADYVLLESDQKAHIDRYREICAVIAHYRPEIGFLYMTPWEIEGVMAFERFADCMQRYQVNLTDHTYWLGVQAFDICLEFRDFGASLSMAERHIPREKLRLQPYYPVVSKDAPFEGYPFERTPGDFVIFSGGMLFKTKDAERTYYRIVDAILTRRPQVKFWFASRAPIDEDILWLKMRHAGRVFFMPERKDLYQVLENVDLYLNTTPELGGLMTQYAAIAGRLPVTHSPLENPLDGLLQNLDKLDLVRQDIPSTVDLVTYLIDHSEERKRRGRLAQKSVMTEEAFTENLGSILREGTSAYPFHEIDYHPEKELEQKNSLRNFIDSYGKNIQDVARSLRG